MTSQTSRALLPAAAAILAGAGAAVAALYLVGSDLVRDDGPTVLSGGAGARAFVGTMAVLAGAGAYFLVRRLVRGPSTSRRGWTLSLPRVAPRAEGYRTAQLPSVGDLMRRLQARGYQLEAHAVDDTDEVRGSIDPRTPLAGSGFLLRDARLGPPATGVLIKVSPHVTGDAGGLATVEARDSRGDACEELAGYAIVELAALVPGLTYRPDDSALPPDDVDGLRAALPDRPRALP